MHIVQGRIQDLKKEGGTGGSGAVEQLHVKVIDFMHMPTYV